MSLPQDYFTIAILATFAGMVFAVNIVVFFFKDWIKKLFGDAGVRPFAAIVAFAIQLFVLYVQVQFTLEKIGLALLNAILVAVASYGVHEFIKDPKAQTTRISNDNVKFNIPIGNYDNNFETSPPLGPDIGNTPKSDAQNGS